MALSSHVLKVRKVPVNAAGQPLAADSVTVEVPLYTAKADYPGITKFLCSRIGGQTLYAGLELDTPRKQRHSRLRVAVGTRYSAGTISVSGTAVTGSLTSWVTAGIAKGWKLLCGGKVAHVKSVTNATHLVLEAATLDDGSGLSYELVDVVTSSRMAVCLAPDVVLGGWLRSSSYDMVRWGSLIVFDVTIDFDYHATYGGYNLRVVKHAQTGWKHVDIDGVEVASFSSSSEQSYYARLDGVHSVRFRNDASQSGLRAVVDLYWNMEGV